MAALPPSADVFHLERRRLEEAAADLRSLLAEKNEQLSEQCAKCAHEEEKLLRSKYLAEFEEISLQKDALKAKLEKNTSDLEHQEMDLNRAEERKKAVEEYQSHLRLTEGTKNDLVARISQLKAKQRGATESLKSQMCHVLEAHQKEEAKLSQKLRGQEEALARNEACATADVLQGMTPQESLAADLKHQLSASQEKVATLEASVESMQALSFQKEPLGVKKVADSTKGSNGHSGLELFVNQSGPSVWPKTCPIGYSQHLGAIEEDCEINFCVKSNIFNSQGFPIIKRPPYSNAPKIYKYTVPLLVVNNDTGQIWSKRSNSTLWVLATKSSVAELAAETNPDGPAHENVKSTTHGKQTSSSQSSRDAEGVGAMAGIIFGVTALLIAVMVIGWRRHNTIQRESSGLMEPLIPNECDAVNEQGSLRI